jgi:hypothetical protein
MHACQRAVLGPAADVVVDGASMDQVAGPHLPRAAVLGIYTRALTTHRMHTVRGEPCGISRDLWRDDRPLGSGARGRVARWMPPPGLQRDRLPTRGQEKDHNPQLLI